MECTNCTFCTKKQSYMTVASRVDGAEGYKGSLCRGPGKRCRSYREVDHHGANFSSLNPVDPATHQRLPLGLNFLQLDREKTYELVKKSIDIENKAGKRISFGHDGRIHDLIFRDTNGQVGAIRIFLFHAVSFNMKTPAEIFRFVSQAFYRTDLRGSRAFLSVDAETIAKLALC
jgi:hypothetical protein